MTDAIQPSGTRNSLARETDPTSRGVFIQEVRAEGGRGMAGSNEDWEAWFDANAPALILFARQWTGSHADAEDVGQEAFIRYWRVGRHRADDPRAYLFASVKRAALDARRGQIRRELRESKASRRASTTESAFESSLERDERRAGLESALALLPEAQREVLVLKVWGGLTFPQIAVVCGAPANTAASRYRYALDALRALLIKDVEALP